MNIIKKIESLGVNIKADGNDLLLTGNTQALTPDQIEWLKAHKPQILAELRAANQDDPVTRLRALAPKYRLDPDELVNWYRNDIEMIQAMDDKTLLRKVTTSAWAVIADSFLAATDEVTTVTFTERLLRPILKLKPDQH